MTRQYPVVYEWAAKNFSGYAPDIPGCIATAKSLPMMRRSLKSALEAHLQWLQDDGDPIPPASRKVTVDMKEDREFPNPPGYYVVVERLDIALPKKKRASNRKSAMHELHAA